ELHQAQRRGVLVLEALRWRLPPTPPSPARGEGEEEAHRPSHLFPPPLRGRVRVGGLQRIVLALLFALSLLSAQPAAAKDELVIGVTNIPQTYHPSIDPVLVKSYILAMTRRPLTAFDKDWKLVCMLCTELPTLENGKAKRETLPDGKPGIAVTYTIQPG